MRHRSRRLIRLPLLPFLVAAVLAGGCSDAPAPESAPPDPEADLRARLELDPREEIHRITIGGRGGEVHVVPSSLTVPENAIVAFTTVDGRTHTVLFPPDSLPLDAALFMERTGQLESPPLVDRGARFVVTLDGAPSGRYRYLVRGPGGETWGVLVVSAAR